MSHGESWLFCTPPPDDVPIRLSSGRDQDSNTTDTADQLDMDLENIEEQRADILSEIPQVQLAKRSTSLQASTHSQTRSSSHPVQLQRREQTLATLVSEMVVHDVSLTSSTNVSVEASTSARSHPSSLAARKPHLTTSKSVGPRSVSRSSHSRGADYSPAKLGQLTVYSTSEEDSLGHNSKVIRDSTERHIQYNSNWMKKAHLSLQVGDRPSPRKLHGRSTQCKPSQLSRSELRNSSAATTKLGDNSIDTSTRTKDTTMASKTGSNVKRQAESPNLGTRQKRRKAYGPFIEISSDSDTDGDTGSSDECDKSSLKQSVDNSLHANVANSAPSEKVSPVPKAYPSLSNQWSARGVKERLAKMRRKKEDASWDRSAPFTPNRQAAPRTEVATNARPMQSQLGKKQPASFTAPQSENLVRNQEKQPLVLLVQRLETQSSTQNIALAPRATYSRPSKAIPTTAFRLAKSVPGAAEPSRTISASGSSPTALQPTTKKHASGAGISKPSNGNVTNGIKGLNNPRLPGVQKLSQPQAHANVVGDLLGGIRQDEQSSGSKFRQTTSSSMAPEKSVGPKTAVYKQLYSSTPTGHTSTVRSSQSGHRAGPEHKQAGVAKTGQTNTNNGDGPMSFVSSPDPSRHSQATSINRSQSRTPNTASYAQKRKIEDVPGEPGNTKLSSKRPAVSAAPRMATAQSQGPAPFKQKSTKVFTASLNANPRSASPDASLETVHATKGQMAASQTHSSLKSWLKAPSSTPSTPKTISAAQKGLANHDSNARLTPHTLPEMSKAVESATTAPKSSAGPSRMHNVPVADFMSREKWHRSPIVLVPGQFKDNQPAVRHGTISPHSKECPDVPGHVEIPSASTQKSLSIHAPQVLEMTPAALCPSFLFRKENKVASKKHPRPIEPTESQQLDAQNSVPEVNSQGPESAGRSVGRWDNAAEKTPNPNTMNVSIRTQKGTSQPLGPYVDSKASHSNLSHPESSTDPGLSNHQRISVVPRFLAEPMPLLDPKSSHSLTPAEGKATKFKTPVAKPLDPMISPVPSRRDMPDSSVAAVVNLSTSAALPEDAEPFFEYSVLQKVSYDADNVSSDTDLVLSSSCTNIDEANAQAKTVFDNMREQYQQHFAIHFSEAISNRDDDGCDRIVGTFAPVDHPSKRSFLQVWVHRAFVSPYAGQTPRSMKCTSFISKTVYVIRLFKLLIKSADSDEDETTADRIRVHHPHSATECYTTLTGANRAAKRLQIELSHELIPTPADILWQKADLAELNQKARDLEAASAGEEKYWKTIFNGVGLGSEKLELFVEKVGLCGPRNL